MSKRPDRRGDAGGEIVGVGGGSSLEHLAGRKGPADALEGDAVGELLLDPAGGRATLELVELLLGSQALQPGRRLQRGDERRAARRELRVEDVVGPHRRRGIRLAALDLAPLAPRPVRVATGQERKAKVEAGDAAIRLRGDKRLQALERPLGPRGDRRSDRGLDRVGIGGQQLLEVGTGLLPLAVLEQLLGVTEGARLGIVPDEEPELERRRPLFGLGRRGLDGRLVLRLEDGDADDERGRGGGGDGHEKTCADARGHARMVPQALA